MLGTIVIYGLTKEEKSTQNVNDVLPAMVVSVHGADCVNLRVFGDVGNSFSVTSVCESPEPVEGIPQAGMWLPKPE